MNSAGDVVLVGFDGGLGGVWSQALWIRGADGATLWKYTEIDAPQDHSYYEGVAVDAADDVYIVGTRWSKGEAAGAAAAGAGAGPTGRSAGRSSSGRRRSRRWTGRRFRYDRCAAVRGRHGGGAHGGAVDAGDDGCSLGGKSRCGCGNGARRRRWCSTWARAWRRRTGRVSGRRVWAGGGEEGHHGALRRGRAARVGQPRGQQSGIDWRSIGRGAAGAPIEGAVVAYAP